MSIVPTGRLATFLALFPAFCVLVPPAHGQERPIHIGARPDPVYVERAAAGQFVNFDFIVENRTDETWTVRTIEVSVRDARHNLVLRKFVNDNGNSPGIATLNQRELPPHGRILIFNPLFAFPPDIPLANLSFALTWQSTNGASAVVDVRVTPMPYESGTALILPLRGRMLVWDGHDYYSHHRRFDYLTSQAQADGARSNPDRYGYDFVLIDEAGALHKGGRDATARNADWFGFGQPIYAAGAGHVVAVSDSSADDRQVDQEKFAKNRLADYGNYILIEHRSGEIALYGHIRQGSAVVRPGENVRQGQMIAAIGASGSSLMPHLHFQLQMTADADGEGLPSYFDSFARLLGGSKITVKRGQIDSGDIVERAR